MDDDALVIDLVLAWNWKYDRSFIRIVDRVCQKWGMTFLAVSTENLATTLDWFTRTPFSTQVFLDRASESDDRFLPLTAWAQKRSTCYINARKHAVHASDKAAVHYDLIKAGLHTPYTIVIPPFDDGMDISGIDLTRLGVPFVAKPSHGGGNEGVIPRVWSFDQIQQARRQFPEDAFLLQALIQPAWIDSRKAWFRCIYCCGEVFVNWWDTETHVYTPVKSESDTGGVFTGLSTQMRIMADTLHMDLFSSEIACTDDGKYIVVDYVNDPIDLRLQSETADGVPDEIVGRIAELIVTRTKRFQDG